MKAFAVVLLCFFAAVQGRSTGVEESPAPPPAISENPWVVHLRIAVSTSGLLDSCVGSLISDRWVLTSASCLRTQRFIWLRYGAQDVVRPELVTETSTVRIHPGYDATTGANDVALISINRAVESSDNISRVSLPSSDAASPDAARLCGYGTENYAAGENLSCSEVSVSSTEDGNLLATTGASRFDNGAALVSDGVQYGVLSQTNEDGVSLFINIVPLVDWIASTAGIATPAAE